MEPDEFEFLGPSRPEVLPPLHCAGCAKKPAELPEYSRPAAEELITPDEYVRREEGTLNRESGRFLCTRCYLEAGAPTGPNGWRVPHEWTMPGH